uniref:Uncharacterized protein n=1 Tax=Arundo donax TaxID=35708 RepID=A0A0A9BUP9_ARUDO
MTARKEKIHHPRTEFRDHD